MVRDGIGGVGANKYIMPSMKGFWEEGVDAFFIRNVS